MSDDWVPTKRGRAWLEHIARLQLNAGTVHDHRHGWEQCPTCANPGDFRRCGEPTCIVCATP